MIKKYRKKPIVIEAILFENNDQSKDAVLAFVTCAREAKFNNEGVPFLNIFTLEGVMTAQIGDYIIKGVNGEFYPCKPDIFDKTYEIVTE